MKLRMCGIRRQRVSIRSPYDFSSGPRRLTIMNSAGGPRVSFSGHIFQPLQFNSDGSVKDLDCSTDAKFEVGFTRGIGAAANGKAVIASDGSPRFADVGYQLLRNALSA